MKDEWYQWLRVNDAARVCGVTARAIYLRIKQGLEAREIRSKSCVRPIDVHANFVAHGRRPAGLINPPADAQASAPTTPGAYEYEVDGEILRIIKNRDPFAMDPDDLGIILSIGGLDKGKITGFVQAVRAAQNRRSIDLRAGKTFTPDEVVEMLRWYGRIFVDEVDAGAAAWTSKALAWIRQECGVQLADKNAAVQQLLENHYRTEYGNAILAKIEKRVADEVAGVKSMEFTAEASK